MEDLHKKVIDALRSVIDYEINVNVYDGGMILDLKVDENGNVSFKFRPTSPTCPIALKLANDIKEAVLQIKGVSNVKINIVEHIMARQIEDIVNSY